MIWFIVFVLICGQLEQFNCSSESTDRKISFDGRSEYSDKYFYELTPSSLDGSELIHPMINSSKEKLKKSNITDSQPGIPFHLIIRLVNARTSRPLVGAYIYVWHVDIHGIYSNLNDTRRFTPYGEFEENPPPDRPWNFDHQPDSRQDYGRNSRMFCPPNKSKEAFNHFDEQKLREPFKLHEFHGSLYNQSRNSFNKSYDNSSIRDFKLANSSYSLNNSKYSTDSPRDHAGFTQSVHETRTYPFKDTSFINNSTTNKSISSNFTKADNLTSKVNDIVEIHGQKHYANETQRHFLQGYQITNFNGDVSFITIVPGWIANRSLHVNVHVYLDESLENASFVGQLYFPNEFADKLKWVPMYSQANRQNLTKNDEDQVFLLNNGNSTLLKLETIGSGYQSIITLGIDPMKTIKP